MERQRRRRRRRPALSCIECRRRKIKCDRSDPCGHCLSTSAQCNFKLFGDEAPHPGAPKRSAVQATPAPSTRTRRVYGNVPAAEQADCPSTVPAAESTLNPDTPVAGRDSAGRQGGGETPGTRSQGSVGTSLSILSETGQGILASQFGLEPSQILLNKTRTLRSSHWMGVAGEVNESKSVVWRNGANSLASSGALIPVTWQSRAKQPKVNG